MKNNKQLMKIEDTNQLDKFLSSFIDESSARKNLNKYFFFLLGFILIVFIWSQFTHIDQTINIKGQIIPQDGIAKIKHESGGEVIKIHVNNYKNVKKGDLLLTIDNQKILTSLKQNQSKLKVVDSQIAHAVSFLKDNIKNISSQDTAKKLEAFLNNISDTISHSQELNRASRLASDHKDQMILQQINMNKIEITRLKDEIVVLDDQLDYLNQQREIFQKLLESRNVSKIRAIDYELKYREVLRESKKARSDLNLKVKETSELESRRIVQKQDGIREKYEELVELNKEKIDLISNISQLQTSLDNLNIYAPITGNVQGLDIVKGVTVQPGEEVLSLIPTNSNFVFEAKASLEQKGKINLGSKSEVQFDGFNILQYSRIPAKILNISPFTFNEGIQEKEFFKVVVKLESTKIKSKNHIYDIKPGMSGTLYVSTGEQSLFAYLFGPIYNAFAHLYDQK